VKEGEDRRREAGKGRAVLYEPYHFLIRSAASDCPADANATHSLLLQ